MSYPILGLCGPAGSGKDTIAAMVGETLGGCQRMGFADALKRFAQNLFEFTDDQLWGPSEMRNAPDPKWTPERIDDVIERGYIPHTKPREHVKDILGPEYTMDLYGQAMSSYNLWLAKAMRSSRERQEVTPRYILQTLGTEWGRAVDRNVWVRKALRDAEEVLEDPEVLYERSRGITSLSARGPTPQPPKLVTITDVRFKNEVLAILKQGGMVWNIRPKTAAAEAEAATAKAGVAGHSSEAELNSIPEAWFTGTIVNDKAQGLDLLKATVTLMTVHTLGTLSPRVSDSTNLWFTRLI